MLDIPSLIGTDIDSFEGLSGSMAIVDGQKGLFITDPDADLLAAYEKQIKELEDDKKALNLLKGLDNVTNAAKR